MCAEEKKGGCLEKKEATFYVRRGYTTNWVKKRNMHRGGSYCLDDDLDDFPEAEFDQQTQARLDAAVDRLLKGYNWTLQPLANK